MGYYHIQLSDNSSNLCIIIIPWGKYYYKVIPMTDLFHGFEFIPTYIYDILILTKQDWTDNVKKL